jgi:hypothetical protein
MSQHIPFWIQVPHPQVTISLRLSQISFYFHHDIFDAVYQFFLCCLDDNHGILIYHDV